MSSTTLSPGEIYPGTLYTLDRAMQVTGWGKHSMREARRNGLAMKYTAGRAYVLGSELIRYITENGKSSSRGVE